MDQVTHVIDCDAAPLIPHGTWKVEEHRQGGQVTWDLAGVKLHLSVNQMGDQCIEGNKLREELANKPVLNANVLDYLLHYPNLIPEDWKVDEAGNTRYVYFWGTVYRDSDGNLYVRNLFFGGERWRWTYNWLNSLWNCHGPAVLLVG
jgi:hypothetical protein